MAMKIINTPQKPTIPLTDEEKEYHKTQELCHICKKVFYNDENSKEYKKHCKVRDHCRYTGKYRGAAHSECNLNYSVQNIIPLMAHNGSNYDYHFIIKKLAKQFKGCIECLGENMEKCISFSVPLKVENINNDKIKAFKLKFIDTNRLMSSALGKLVDNLSKIKDSDKETYELIDNMRSTAR